MDMRLEVQWNGLRDELSQSSMSEELHGKEKSQAIPASQQNRFMEAESFMHDRPSHVPENSPDLHQCYEFTLAQNRSGHYSIAPYSAS